MSANAEPLLVARDLVKEYPVGRRVLFRPRGSIRAVDGVSLDVGQGETVALVGESGSGKTTVGRLVLRLVDPTSGSVHFDGQPVFRMGGRRLRALRRQMQIVFQDPVASLNPRLTAGAIVGEGLAIHRIARGADRERRVAELLETVGLPAECRGRRPHEFSGGQRQRIAIARALSTGPRFLVLDEATTALDVSVQAQILNLLMDLRGSLRLAFLVISHNLGVVRHVADRVHVMAAGRIVESAPAPDLFASPLHPCTRMLLAAEPAVDADRTGAEPAPAAPPGSGPAPAEGGCPFLPRCPEAAGRCRIEDPPLRPAGGGRAVACHFAPGGDGSGC